MSERIFRRLFVRALRLSLACLFLSFAQIVSAQDLAQISGTVTDQNGAALAGATVTLQSTALAIERTVTASDNGTYSIPQIRPGVSTLR